MMIAITLLLVTILLLVLRFTVRWFRKKAGGTSLRCGQQTAGLERIIRTQLDLDMPYAQIAPPSYSDTITADRRTHQDETTLTEHAF
jgi:hypothetical protein